MRPRNRNGSDGDNGGDMNAEWTDHDIEALLRGRRPASGDLARLSPVIDKLRARTQGTPDAALVAERAALLAEAVRHPSSDGSRRRSGASRPAAAWRRRVGFAVIAAGLATAGLAGTAAAADGSAPGDPLYGIDRALEKIGIDNGGTHERLQEAEVLANRGEIDAALVHAANALRNGGDASSSAALADAAAVLEANGSENSAAVHARVSEMLGWMSTAEPGSKDFGQQVSDYARQIGKESGSADNPGNSGNAGKPDNPGNSGNAGKPDNPGNSGNAGNSDSPGNSGNAGKPDKNVPNSSLPSEDSPANNHAH